MSGDHLTVLTLEREQLLILGIYHQRNMYERIEWRVQELFTKARNIQRHGTVLH